MNADRSVVLEFVNKIFLEYSPQYNSIKQIAEKNLAEDLLNQIKDFLKDRQSPKQQLDLKKFFKDPSNVREEDINDIVDAFVSMRDSGVLNQIEKNSINGILILFNQWIAQRNETESIFESINNVPKNINELEQQIMNLQPQEVKELELYPEQRNLYTTVIQQDIYSSLPQGMHIEETNPYFSNKKPEYKAMRQSNL